MQPTDLRKSITDNIECGYLRLFHKKLPPVLTTREIEALNIRQRAALDKDVTTGRGLLPLPNTGKGKPRRYLVSQVVSFLAGADSNL